MDTTPKGSYLIRKSEVKCIFCGRNSADGEEYKISDEHVIPQVLGGWLTIPFVCVSCNNDRFGAHFEADLKKNGFVVAAIEKLKLQSKALAYKEAKLTLTIDGDKPLVAYFDKADAPKHFPQRIDDGSLIIPEDQAKVVLRKQIERYERATGTKVLFDIDSYDTFPYGLAIPIYPTNLCFIKHRNRKSSLTISELDKPIPFIVPAKIAFEHLAGLYYRYVLREEFNPIRDWLHHGDPNINNHVLLSSFLRDKMPDELTYQPFHFVRLGYQQESLSAIVCLFGTIYFSVFLAHIPDFSSFPFPQVIGTYHLYDLQNRSLYTENAPGDIRKEDEMYLDIVSQFGRAQIRTDS
jgi:hypothetical protein